MAEDQRWWSGALTVVVTAGLLSAPATSAQAGPGLAGSAGGAAATGQAPSPRGTVTLVTGDRVTLSSTGNPSVVAHPSRDDVGFTSFQQAGDVYVMPSDAMTLLADGRVDRQLFNVSAIIEAGYGDRGDLPMVVTHRAGLRTDARGRLADAGVAVADELRSANSLVVRPDRAELPGFWRRLAGGQLGRGTQVWLDQLLQPVLADSVPQVDAPPAWAAGFDGTGVRVAVLDTGVDTAHPDLAGKVVATENFTSESALDVVGHGTHVAATIGGTGSASIGANAGVAPGASLLSGKVCEVEGCPLSAIIAGMEWAAGQEVSVVNMSLSGQDSPGLDPLELAVENLTATTGTLFVASADNRRAHRTIGSPASADSALAVGAVDGADQLAVFSSQGPRIGDSAIKPDITAPGVDVTAARSQHSPLPGDVYTSLQGTSMAAPHVAGAAAILAHRHPDWTPEMLKAGLMGAAAPTPGLGVFSQGAGRLEVFGAVNQQVLASPPSVSLGAVAQTTPPGTIVHRDVTYHNHGTGAVTLNLSVSTLGPTGSPVPAMFTLSASSVTIPAGGDATVTLTTDTGATGPAGFYSGWITATGGAVTVRTPFALDREATITLTHIGRTGGNPLAYNTVILPVDNHAFYQVAGQPGPVTVRVPVGHYLIASFIFDLSPTGADQSIVVAPRLDATAAHSLTMDATVGQPVQVTVPDPAAQHWRLNITSELNVPGAGTTAITSLPATLPIYTANAGPTHVPGYRAKIASTHYVPGPGGGFENASQVYHSAWFFANRMPNGIVRTPAAGSYATVDARYAAHVAGTTGFTAAFAHPGSGTFIGGANGLPVTLPFNRIERFLSEGNVRWESIFEDQVPATNETLVRSQSAPIGYTAGSTQVQWWNRPVYGPGLAGPLTDGQWAVRTGNEISLLLPMMSDGDGHAGFPNAGFTSGTVQISRNGQLLYDQPYDPLNGRVAVVPPDFGTYQLIAIAQRGGAAELGTFVSARWTFTSQTVNGGTLRLPLWTVRATPSLSASNTAPKGAPFTIPLRAVAPPSSPAAGLRTVTAQFSVDDGQTWQPAAVSSAPGGTHLVSLTHPNQAGFVSLRFTVLDFAGNALEQEVIRAYRIG